MSLDWQLLAPHVPTGELHYVEPPGRGAAEIVGRLQAGTGVVLLGGPTGIGKSTELRRTASLLHGDHVACLVPLDVLHNVRKLDVDQLCIVMAHCLSQLSGDVLELELSPFSHSLARVVSFTGASITGADFKYETTPFDALLTLIEEVRRIAAPRPVVLLLDGLEKVHDTRQALELFGLLGSLPAQVRIVSVVPWLAAFGNSGDALIRSGEWFFPLRAWDVEGQSGVRGRLLMTELLLRRLHEKRVPSNATDLLSQAAEWSGGVPRTFLQLVADAGTYARLRGNVSWPQDEDLDNAIADLQDSFRRLLLPGDTEAILVAEGTDGRELELSRKIRFFAHGILLERLRGRRPVVEIHPLARLSIRESGKVLR